MLRQKGAADVSKAKPKARLRLASRRAARPLHPDGTLGRSGLLHILRGYDLHQPNLIGMRGLRRGRLVPGRLGHRCFLQVHLLGHNAHHDLLLRLGNLLGRFNHPNCHVRRWHLRTNLGIELRGIDQLRPPQCQPAAAAAAAVAAAGAAAAAAAANVAAPSFAATASAVAAPAVAAPATFAAAATTALAFATAATVPAAAAAAICPASRPAAAGDSAAPAEDASGAARPAYEAAAAAAAAQPVRERRCAPRGRLDAVRGARRDLPRRLLGHRVRRLLELQRRVRRVPAAWADGWLLLLGRLLRTGHRADLAFRPVLQWPIWQCGYK